MTRGKFRLLLAIGVLCQICVFLIRHSSYQNIDLSDFLTGMGTAVIGGAMILMARKSRLQ